ncbi:hypothetical protein HKX48_003100 [Thoreauomyces humboldtii]|nr:hypothetical protein HKX48_003100 [Thoreauomyces humboldtii]
MSSAWSNIISPLVGWAYFLAWSCSFYPQVILNWKRKSVQGLSLDFLYLNLIGFLSYTIYNLGLFVNPAEYGDSVRLNDLFFSIHALTLTTLTVVQSILYRRTRSRNAISPLTKAFIAGSGLSVLVAALLTLNGTVGQHVVLYLLSLIKMIITVVKYVPQAWFNFSRKSTEGWSIANILLDLTGGSLSLVQIFADASVTSDWSPVVNNPVKFGLGLVSIGFDILFMFQHYVLYAGARRTAERGPAQPLPAKEDEEYAPLLVESSSEVSPESPTYGSRDTTVRNAAS